MEVAGVGLPEEVQRLVCSFLSPYELSVLAPVTGHYGRLCRSHEVWQDQVAVAVSSATRSFGGRIASRGARAFEKALLSRLEERALPLRKEERGGEARGTQPAGSPVVLFYLCVHALPSIAVKLAADWTAEEPAAPGRGDAVDVCFVSVDRRCYDVTGYLDQHPGGRDLLRQYHGGDATAAFDVFGHSAAAHNFMRQHLLIFDAARHVGRCGEPFVIMGRVPRPATWWGQPWYLLRTSARKSQWASWCHVRPSNKKGCTAAGMFIALCAYLSMFLAFRGWVGI